MHNIQLPKGIAIDIQAIGMTLREPIQQHIFRMLEKLQLYFAGISWADFYIRQSSRRTAFPRTINVRLGIPGPNIFVSESGKSWKAIMGRIEEKIIKQLKKRKERTRE